tara:strand:- start:298 stop:480 length:183 start_codon:yes stop_codon:yes gene_type:complete
VWIDDDDDDDDDDGHVDGHVDDYDEHNAYNDYGYGDSFKMNDLTMAQSQFKNCITEDNLR